MFLAISSDKLIIFETLIPGAGSNSYKLTTGPLLTFLIFPLIEKSNKIFSINSGLGFLDVEPLIFCFFSSKLIKGSLYSFVCFSGKFLNEKVCCLVSVGFSASSVISISLMSVDSLLIFPQKNILKKTFLRLIPEPKIKKVKVKSKTPTLLKSLSIMG